MMRHHSFSVSLAKNPAIKINVTQGHFSTSHAHMTHYLDLNNLKTNALIAKEVAEELAQPYLAGALVDTIVCMEGTEVIGASMAEVLLDSGTLITDEDMAIHVLIPLRNTERKLMFPADMHKLIRHRNIILLISSISTGITLNSALDCLSYYGAQLVGVSALFNAKEVAADQVIHAMFTKDDIVGYELYRPGDCPMCQEGQKLDGIIIHDGCSTM